MIKYIYPLFAFLLVGFVCAGQTDSSSIVTKIDSAVTSFKKMGEEPDSKSIVRSAPADSSQVRQRAFDQQQVDELKSDKSLQYKEEPTIAETVWDRILQWLRNIFSALFKSAVTTNWGRVVVYIIALAALVIIIMMLLKVDAFKIIFSGQGKSNLNYQVLEEDIHAMDFDTLIREAARLNDYRKGVRLIFLYALKILSDKNHIHWESGKTNHDYVAELKAPELKAGFNDLSFYFEYAWYGNFSITQDTFNRVQHIFMEWRGNVS